MKPVIVVGMHRSGTSLMVKILEELGVFMGADQEHNGESLFFMEINKWIMHQTHASWDNPQNCKYLSEEAKETLIPIIKNRLKSFHKKDYFGKLRKQNSFSDTDFQWGWKDPRNTFTFDVWKEIFINSKIIHIYRNPIDVAESLIQREKKIRTNIGNPTGTGIRKKLYGLRFPQKNLFAQSFRCLDYSGCFSLWKEYITQAFNISDDPSTIIHISFEELISSTEEVIANLSDFLKLKNNIIVANNIFDFERKFAFLNNPELVDYYRKVRYDKLMKKLNYGHLIHEETITADLPQWVHNLKTHDEKQSIILRKS